MEALKTGPLKEKNQHNEHTEVTLKGFLLPVYRLGKSYIIQTRSGLEYTVKMQKEMNSLYSRYEYEEIYLKGLLDYSDKSITVHSIGPAKPKKTGWTKDLSLIHI